MRHRIDKIQKSVKMFQFPILGIPRKLKILVKPLVRKVHNNLNRRPLITTNAMKFQKCLPERATPTPHMMPKFNSITNTNLELNGFWKGWPALFYGLNRSWLYKWLRGTLIVILYKLLQGTLIVIWLVLLSIAPRAFFGSWQTRSSKPYKTHCCMWAPPTHTHILGPDWSCSQKIMF